MKKVQLITMMLFMMLTTFSFSQGVSEVVSVDSTTTKETLYSNALSFFATTFKSAQNVIQMKDPESGKVIGKGLLSNGRKVTVTISCKDGKYKYDIEYDELTETRLIEFDINKCGVVKGKTYLPVTFIGNRPIININEVYFQNGSEYFVHYDSSHNFIGLSKSAVEKWKIAVDEEFKTKEVELSNLVAKKDIEVDMLILTLKDEMSKSDW
jgi:hypothetical protein